MKRLFLIALTLTALILNLTGCGNHIKAFEQFVRDGNYTEAITLYQEKLMDDSESYATCQEMVQAYLEESLTAYAQGDMSRIEAEEVLHTMEMLEDYLYLVDGLEEGHTLYSDLRNSKNDFREAEQYRENGELEPDLLTELEAMAEEYKAYIPVKLADLRPVRQGTHVSVGIYYSDLYTDINGDTYDKDSVISPTGTMAYDGVAKTDDDGSAVYNLNFAYNTFTATIYRPYGFLSYPGDLFENMSVVRIYGDDVMLYEFLDPGESWDVCTVEVDVSGVRNLKIVVRGSWNSTTALIAPANWQPRICLAEGVLQK